MKKFRILFTIIIALLFFVPSAYAIEVKAGELVSVHSNEIVNGSLFAGGSSITVEGRVMGDIFCAGQNIVIAGVVDGDVLCTGQNIRISGSVGGDVRAAGQVITIENNISRNVMIAGQTLIIAPGATVGGEILFGGQTFSLEGSVVKSIAGASQSTFIDGPVGGNVDVQTNSLRLGDHATVSGVLRRIEPKKATVAKPKKPQFVLGSRHWPVNTIPGIIIHMVVGIIVVALFPLFTVRVQKSMSDNPVMVGLMGAAVVLLAPVVLLSLLLTIIGIPAALLGIVLYALLLSLSRLFVGTLVGRVLLENFAKKSADNLYLQVIAGVPVLWFMQKAPVIGGILTFLTILWGTGGILFSFKKTKKS